MITGATDIGNGAVALTIDHDPLVTPTDAPAGSLLFYIAGGTVWVKNSSGSNSDVSLLRVTGAAQVYVMDGATTAAYTIVGRVRQVHVINVPTSDVTITLHAASAFAKGDWVLVVCVDGSASSSKTITVQRAGTDTVEGAAGFILTASYANLMLVSDGVSKWTRMS